MPSGRREVGVIRGAMVHLERENGNDRHVEGEVEADELVVAISRGCISVLVSSRSVYGEWKAERRNGKGLGG